MIEIQPGLIYLTREDWGARIDIPRLGHPVNRLDRTEAIMHHTVITDDDTTPNRWETMDEVKAEMVRLQTIRPNLGLDVPYNFVAFHMIDGTLVICEGRGMDLTGAHTHAHNTRGIATAGQGNFNLGQGLNPYVVAWSGWWGHLKYAEGMENLGSSRPTSGPNAGAIAFGHRDLAATSCPGTHLYAIIPQLTFKTQEEDYMPLELARNTRTGATYALTGPFKTHLSPLAVEAMEARGAGWVRLDVSDPTHNARLDALPDALDVVWLDQQMKGHASYAEKRRNAHGRVRNESHEEILAAIKDSGGGGSGGLTLEETIEAGQEAARRGTDQGA